MIARVMRQGLGLIARVMRQGLGLIARVMRQGLGRKCKVAGQGPFVLLNVCHLSTADHACVGCVVSYSNTDVTVPVAWTAAVV